MGNATIVLILLMRKSKPGELSDLLTQPGNGRAEPPFKATCPGFRYTIVMKSNGLWKQTDLGSHLLT